jgi:hypothetical protein
MHREGAELTFGFTVRPRTAVSDTLDRVECQRFTNFEDEEQARERDVGARGQAVIGRMGFRDVRLLSLGGRCAMERRPPGRDASANIDMWCG